MLIVRFLYLCLYFFVRACDAGPNQNTDSQNVLTLHLNCPEGQRWINGLCRVVGKAQGYERRYVATESVPSASKRCSDNQEWINNRCRYVGENLNPGTTDKMSPSCPSGQIFVNGRCRDVWFHIISRAQSNFGVGTGDEVSTQTIIDMCKSAQQWMNGNCNILKFNSNTKLVVNCAPGQELLNGKCRTVWKREAQMDMEFQNTVTEPSYCKSGDIWIHGRCHDALSFFGNSKNAIVVPINCPPGQQFINDRCRDVWASNYSGLQGWRDLLNRKRRQKEDIEKTETQLFESDSSNRNVIDVPNQCPAGYKPDALGYCRPILPI